MAPPWPFPTRCCSWEGTLLQRAPLITPPKCQCMSRTSHFQALLPLLCIAHAQALGCGRSQRALVCLLQLPSDKSDSFLLWRVETSRRAGNDLCVRHVDQGPCGSVSTHCSSPEGLLLPAKSPCVFLKVGLEVWPA